MTLTHYITTREAAVVARALRAAGFRCTSKQANEYVSNLAARMGGMDQSAVREAERIIQTALDEQPCSKK